MNPRYIYSPFDELLTLELVDANWKPVMLNTLTDVKVLLLVNGIRVLQYQKTASVPPATGWLAWAAGIDGQSVVCAVTKAQSDGWRGLLTAQVVNVSADGYAPAINRNLYICKKGALSTPDEGAPVNPISGSLAFSCSTDGLQLLTMTAEANAPNGNYIVQILIEGSWRRLYKGYVNVSNGVDDANGTGSYIITIPKLKQVAAGNYPIRLLNDATGATSEPADTWIMDCWQGEKREGGNYDLYWNGLMASWGWY